MQNSQEQRRLAYGKRALDRSRGITEWFAFGRRRVEGDEEKEEKLAGFNVWFQSVAGEYAERIGEIDDSDLWSVHSQASDGDLVLSYRTAPQSCIVDICKSVVDL
jgi:hypothetical protein